MKEQYACVETTSSRPTVIECPGLHPLLGASETLALAGARNENGNSYTDSRPTVYPAAESGRGVVHCRIAGPVERLSARALHRGTRSRPKTETDAVHDTGADRRRDAAACRRILVRVCRFWSGSRSSVKSTRRKAFHRASNAAMDDATPTFSSRVNSRSRIGVTVSIFVASPS